MKQSLTIFVFSCLFWTILPCHAQNNNGTNFYGSAMPTNVCENQSSFSNEAEAETTVTAILDQLGLKSNFGLSPCPGIGTCQAVMRNNIPYILYDNRFLDKVKGFSFSIATLPNKNKDYISLTILAHEIGHHLNQHLSNQWLRNQIAPRALELEADEFAGNVLYKLGATLSQAQAVMYTDAVSVEGDFEHPPRQQRLEAIERGYNKAKAQTKIEVQERVVEKTINLQDRDNDGLANTIDRCPDEAGSLENKGCPELKPGPTPTPKPRPGTRRDLPNLPEMVFVKGGTFMMGDTFGEGESDEKPTHSVTLDDFYIGKYEVTFEEYDLFCEATGREKPDDEGWGRGKRPVINVNWDDAQAYCAWASSISGNTYTLPTEAQWEYAARSGGRKVRFGNGKNTLDPDEANFNASEDYKEPYSVAGEYRAKTLPVGSFAPNELGLYDMTGNVWEWCRDWYESDYYSNSPVRNPENTSPGSVRVLRGGSWGSSAAYCRVSNRDNISPSYRYINYGFRLALPSGI